MTMDNTENSQPPAIPPFAALAGYAPWQPPFRYNMDGQWIEDSKGQRMLDMRGWGYLTGKGSEALGMDEEAAAKIQDNIGKRTAELLNADVKAPNDKVSYHADNADGAHGKDSNDK